MLDDRLRFLDLSFDLLGIADSQGCFSYVNLAWEKLFGFAPDPLATDTYLDYVHPDDREATEAEAQKVSQGINVVNFENRYWTKARCLLLALLECQHVCRR